MVSAGPRPGSTPMAVPSVVPSRHHKRLTGEKATEKPWASWLSVSMASAPEPACDGRDRAIGEIFDEAGADIDAERLGEAEIRRQRKDQAHAQVAQRAAAAET